MPKVRVTFKECIQDSREYGSDDEYMVSRVSVDIAVDRADQGSFIADLKQAVGTDFDTGPIEVGRPVEVGTHKPYRGPFDQARFAEAATKYFRELLGSDGWAIKLRPGSTNIRMQGNRFVRKKVVEFEAMGRQGW
jgi:hypothetical protein